MKLRKFKRKLTWCDGLYPGLGLFPTWRVKPAPGYRWVGKELVKRK